MLIMIFLLFHFSAVAVFVLTDRVEGFNIDLLGMIDFKGLIKIKKWCYLQNKSGNDVKCQCKIK